MYVLVTIKCLCACYSAAHSCLEPCPQNRIFLKTSTVSQLLLWYPAVRCPSLVRTTSILRHSHDLSPFPEWFLYFRSTYRICHAHRTVPTSSWSVFFTFRNPMFHGHCARLYLISFATLLVLCTCPTAHVHKDACTPLVGGTGFWARLLLLCRENSPLLWLWVWGGLEPCTTPFSLASSQPNPAQWAELEWLSIRGGSIVHSASNFTVLGIHRWRTIKAVKYSENWHQPQEQGVECTESHGDGSRVDQRR